MTIPRIDDKSNSADGIIQQTAIPPPKPSTRPILADLDLTDSPHYTMTNFPRASYHASGSDSGNGSGDSVQSSAAGDISDSAVQCTVLTHRPGGVIIKNPISLSSSFSSTTLKDNMLKTASGCDDSHLQCRFRKSGDFEQVDTSGHRHENRAGEPVRFQCYHDGPVNASRGRISSPVEAASIGQWESSSPDLGLKTLTMHMEESRRVVRSLPSFRRNSEIVLSDARVVDLLSDVFRTEFQLKFLWGSRGANVKSSERYAKFEQILTAMSDMCEPRPKSPPSPAPMSPGSYNPAIGTSVRWPCQWTPDLLNIDSTRWIPSTYSSRWVAVYHSTPSCCQTGATSCPRQFQLPPRGRLGTPKATSVIKEWSS
ncbi:unnamed protein product [Nesidiocoris tenuis]|uniref:Uncharacterized protein n=1 Tax=Nesidiocoris tenuis TaxID=355587 RepID=A0A6H5H580_9HEMI|nr:unnamed protein product [Nesidiocoris tenuis]